MIETFIEFVSNVPGTMAFALVILVLLGCGLGFPLPEEIPILAATYLAYTGEIPLSWAIPLTVLAALAGDSILFYLGHHFGRRIFEIPPFSTLVTRRRLRRANVYFHRWGNGVVFLARFLAGVRATVFLTAAILRMSYRRFILMDGLAATISIPLNMILVYKLLKYFGEDLESAISISRKMGRSLMVTALAVILLIALFVFLRARRKRNIQLATRRDATRDDII